MAGCADRGAMDATYHLAGGFKPTLKRFADLDGPDFPIPVWATQALVENEPFVGEKWEPACGDGAMAQVLHVGVKSVRQKFARLLRLAFLEGANRANTIFAKCPPSRVWVFSERDHLLPSGGIHKGSGTTAYAWFVWDNDTPNGTELKWFKPGYRSRSQRHRAQRRLDLRRQSLT
jgi:hypothetical protein